MIQSLGKKQKGYVSQAVTFGMVLLGLFVLSNASIVNESAEEKANDANHGRANFYALAGIESALHDIDQGIDPNKTLSFDYGSATVTVTGNQVTSVGQADIARVSQTITANVAGTCVFLICNNFHSAGNDLLGLYFNKSCLDKPTMTRFKASFNPDDGEQITEIRANGQGIYSGSSGSDVWMDVTDYEVPDAPNPSPFDFIRFAAPIRGGKSYTFTAEFTDHSTAQVSCTDSTAPAVCGNGNPETGEECDDGNTNNGDGCSSICTVESGWTCTGNPSVCTPEAGSVCGNGIVETGEGCDDGNTNNGDGCSATCTVESGYTCQGSPSVCTPEGGPGGQSVCGNGNVETGEACDDGNTLPGDGCAADCTVESGYTCTGNPSVCSPQGGGSPVICGNGVVQTGEACDDGNTNNGDGCSSNCAVEPGYSCTGNPSVCTPNTVACGNGTVETGEACDDGNVQNGDGCSFNCQVETGWTCSGSPSSFCMQQTGPICGNGQIESGEICDDGNTVNGDGCAANCVVESGYTCTGTPKSTCTPNQGPVCGNGNVEASEACDDGNTNNGDGCAANCTVETDYTCSGNPSQCTSTVQKYCVCHHTGSATHPYNTISISENAVCTHLQNHGDGPGPCPGDAIQDCNAPTLPDTFQCASSGTVACGNGQIESGETCDDGNTANNDGCSSQCIVESGFTCSGTPSVCVSNGTGTSGLTNNHDGTLTVNPNCTSEFKVLCTDITYGAGGPAVPVKMNRAKNGTYFSQWMFNNTAVKTGDTYSETVNPDQAVTYKVKANAKYGSFNATYQSTNTNQVKVLSNGSPAPTQWAGFGGQQPVSACVGPYTNQQTQKIQLANNQSILLFELGVNTTQYPNSSAIDYQDLVVLITAKNCQ